MFQNKKTVFFVRGSSLRALEILKVQCRQSLYSLLPHLGRSPSGREQHLSIVKRQAVQIKYNFGIASTEV